MINNLIFDCVLHWSACFGLQRKWTHENAVPTGL